MDNVTSSSEASDFDKDESSFDWDEPQDQYKSIKKEGPIPKDQIDETTGKPKDLKKNVNPIVDESSFIKLAKQFKVETFENQSDYQEETDVFEETISTPSLSSEDNKVHLKKASNLERHSFLPVPSDIHKVKLDFNRINELDRFRNIKAGKNFFGHVLKPANEKVRKNFLKDFDVTAGPSSVAPSKKKPMRSSFPKDADDPSSLDEMKSVTNCIVENTLNMLIIDDTKDVSNDNVFGLNAVSAYRYAMQENYVPRSEIIEIPQEFMDCDFDNGSIIDIEDKRGTAPIIIKDLFMENHILNYNLYISPPLSSSSSASPSASPSVPPLPPPHLIEIPLNPEVNNVDVENQESLPIAELSENIFSFQDVNEEETITSSVAHASREAIVDPNSVIDLLDDFEVMPHEEDLNGINIIVVGIHALPENFDVEANNGFPNWLLQILGTQVAVEENIPAARMDEAHFYCQGDGLGVHPSVLAVEVEEDESTESTNNTADFAEVDPGVSSQDMSSLPEDSQGNVIENQGSLGEEGENLEPAAATTHPETEELTTATTTLHVQNEFADSISSFSDAGVEENDIS